MRFDLRVNGAPDVMVPDFKTAGRCSCGARWPGENTCHCSLCHRSFTHVNSFDQHQTGRIHHLDPTQDTRRCRTEEELREAGMEPNEYGLWRKPRPHGSLPERADNG